MKKLTVLIISILVLFLCSCEKPKEEPTIDPNKGKVTFWTSEFSHSSTGWDGWILWVDGMRMGVIAKPYPINTTDKIPVCGDEAFTRLLLVKGRHSYYMTMSIPAQPPPNYFVSQTYYFDIVGGGCIIVRCKQ